MSIRASPNASVNLGVLVMRCYPSEYFTTFTRGAFIFLGIQNMEARTVVFIIWAGIAVNCKDKYRRKSSQRDGGGSIMSDSGERHPSDVALAVALF